MGGRSPPGIVRIVTWEAIFLLAVLKIPVIYVLSVVWYAIRAEPRPYDELEGASVREPSELDPRPGTRLRLGRGGRRRGGPGRTYRRRGAGRRARVSA